MVEKEPEPLAWVSSSNIVNIRTTEKKMQVIGLCMRNELDTVIKDLLGALEGSNENRRFFEGCYDSDPRFFKFGPKGCSFQWYYTVETFRQMIYEMLNLR